jgi:hypothetical protein
VTAVVFLGPSLSLADARSLCEADYRPPAAQGDVYRAARAGARVIAVVDGLFERVPAVWHKEILWALSQGVHVWGASSMGALRAAELASFGMVGVGAVYRRYREGFASDDAVAVSHAGEEHGHRPLSVALVDIERTLQEASLAGVVTAAEAYLILCQARDLFFPDRAWPRILADTVAAGLDHRSAKHLRAWVLENSFSQKRDDARELLSALRVFLQAEPPPFVPDFHFEHTDAWESFVRDAEVSPSVPLGEDADLLDLAAELALDGQLEDARAGGAVLAMADAEARRQGIVFDDRTLRDGERQLRARLGLEEDARFEVWKQHAGLDEAGMRSLLRLFAARTWFLSVMAADATRFLPSHLRMIGRWASPTAAVVDTPDMPDEQLLHDHFLRTRGEPPADLDVWAHASGFASREQLVLALRRRARA